MSTGRHLQERLKKRRIPPPARLLYVDDETALRMLVQENLEEHGFRVSIAEDGDDALELITQESFDVVILDIRMPRMGGIAVLEEIRRREIDTRVIMVTGVDDVGIAGRAAQLGATDYVMKPFETDTLLASIKRVLNV